MKETTRPQNTTGDIPDFPDFLIKTTFGCSLVVIIILIPFTINNFIHDRFVMGLASSSIAVVCLINIWYGIHGRYNLLVNTYLVTPTCTFTITYTMIKLAQPGSYWPLLLVVAYYFVLPERRAMFFNVLILMILIPTAWFVLDQSSAVRFSAVLVGISLFAYISMREINVLYGRIQRQTKTLNEKVRELEHSLQHIKQLEGLLPICSNCKKIRTGEQDKEETQTNWIEIEHYITEHAEVNFSHGICPDCVKKLYSDFYDRKNKKK